MLSIQLVLLTSLVGDSTAIQAGTLINTDEATATKLLESKPKFARALLKHEPTEEQLSKAVDFVDDDGTKDPDEADGEDSIDADASADSDEELNPQRNRRRTRSKPDAS